MWLGLNIFFGVMFVVGVVTYWVVSRPHIGMDELPAKKINSDSV